MWSTIVADIQRRLARPRVFVPLGFAVIGLIAWIILGATDRSSGGAGMWVPAVIVPGATGVAWLLTGVSWMFLGHSRVVGVPCVACGYDMTGLTNAESRCPECGQDDAVARQVPATVRVVTQVPGMVCLLVGVLVIVSALLYSVLISQGVFDV